MTTPAVSFLQASGKPFRVFETEVDGVDFSSIDIGAFFAEQMGIPGERVYKSLMASAQGQLVMGLVPVTQKISLKTLANAVGKKKATMVPPAEAEELSGSVIGGISPFGLATPMPIVIDQGAFAHPTIAVSGGSRELKVELTPADLVDMLGATIAEIAMD